MGWSAVFFFFLVRQNAMMIIPLGRELDGVHLLTLAEQSGAVQRERTELRERERERES